MEFKQSKLCAGIVSLASLHDDGNDSGDDVELLAVDSPLRSSNHSHQPRRIGGILRLRSSDDEPQLNDNDDDALLSLERELTRSGTFTYLFVYFLL